MRKLASQTTTDSLPPDEDDRQVGCRSNIVEVPEQSMPTRHQFTTWLKQLSKQQRYLALQIKNPTLTNTLRHKYQAIVEVENQNLWNLSTTPTNKTKHIPKKYKVFLQSLLFLSDDQYLDSLGFDLNFVDCPQKIYDVITHDSLSFQPHPSDYQYHFEAIKQKNQWINQIIRYIRNNLFLNFHKQWNKNILQQQKNRKKQFSIFWKYLPETEKQKILFLGHSSLSELLIELEERKIFIEPFEIQKQMEELLKLDKNQFCNRIFKCKLKRCFNAIFSYYELVYYQWKQAVLKKKKKEKKYHGKKKNKTNMNNPKKERKKSLDVWSNETNETDSHHKRQKEEKIIKEKNQSFHMQKVQHLQQGNKASTLKKTNCLKTVKKKNMWECEQSKEVEKEKLMNRKIEENIIKLSEEIFQEAREYEDRRALAFDRIQVLLFMHKVGIRLYGSCANSIAIKNSDIDIAVEEGILTWYPCLATPKAKLIGALQYLSHIFSHLPWIGKCNLIQTAKIPIIKLSLNTEVVVTESYIPQQYRQHLNRAINNPGLVSVDITIQTANLDTSLNHLGIISTQMISSWFQFIPILRPITLILKTHLCKHELNQNYNRGLNTYALIVMLISCIKYLRLEQTQNIAEVLQKALLFYACQFDESKFVIDMRKQQVMVPKEEPSKWAELEVADPLDNGNIMTKNCYKYPQIKQLFLEIYKQLYLPNTQLATYSTSSNIIATQNRYN